MKDEISVFSEISLMSVLVTTVSVFHSFYQSSHNLLQVTVKSRSTFHFC